MDEVVGRLTPFMLFYTEHRDAVKARISNSKRTLNNNNNSNNNNNENASKQSTLRPEEISKEVARLWRTLDPERTKDYCLLANLYAESLAKHGATMGAGRGGTNSGSGGKRKLGKRKLKKDPRLPKLPVSSFMWFSRHHRAVLRNGRRDLSFCEIGKAVGALWKASAVSERRPFEDLAFQDKARYTREVAAYKAWFVRTQGSKENKGAVTSAIANAAVASTAGKATSSTAEVMPMVPTVAPTIATAKAVAPSGKPIRAKVNAGVTAPVPAPAQAIVTNAAAGGLAAVFPTYVRPYTSSAFSGAAAGPARLSHSSIFTSSSSSSSASSYSQASSPPLPPPPSTTATTATTAPTIHSPPMKRLKREEPVFGVANVAAVAPKVSESVLDVVAEAGVGVSHRARDGGVRGDSSIVVVSTATSPHVRV